MVAPAEQTRCYIAHHLGLLVGCQPSKLLGCLPANPLSLSIQKYDILPAVLI